MLNKTQEKKKYILSIRLLPSIILTLLSLVFSIAYLDSRYASTDHFVFAGSFFGVSLILLLVDVGMESFYKSKKLPYNIISTCISLFQLFYFGTFSLIYFKNLGDEEPAKRIFPAVLLALLLFINVIYRVLTWLDKWKTDESKGNDLQAAYIGFLGLGVALINSLPFSAIQIYSEQLSMSYIGIFSIIALLAGMIEAIVGACWLSFQKMRSSSKSNLFFYLTIFNFLASLAGIVVAAFGYSYGVVSIVTSMWCFAPYAGSIVLLGSGLAYLTYLGKK